MVVVVVVVLAHVGTPKRGPLNVHACMQCMHACMCGLCAVYTVSQKRETPNSW